MKLKSPPGVDILEADAETNIHVQLIKEVLLEELEASQGREEVK